MIEIFQSVATRLRWTLPIAMTVAILSVATFVATVFRLAGIEDDTLLIPSGLGFMWSALLFYLVATFPHIPPAPSSDDDFANKITIHVKRVLYYLFAIAFVAVTMGVVSVSLKLIDVWQTDF